MTTSGEKLEKSHSEEEPQQGETVQDAAEQQSGGSLQDQNDSGEVSHQS